MDRALKANSFPDGGRAPESFRPSEDPPALEEAVTRLGRAADEFEREVVRKAATPGYLVRHPVFGSLKPVDYLRFQALHTAHHTGQLRATERFRLVVPRPASRDRSWPPPPPRPSTSCASPYPGRAQALLRRYRHGPRCPLQRGGRKPNVAAPRTDMHRPIAVS